MALTIRDVRQNLLLVLILAALPMLIYPKLLGFNIGLSGWSYIGAEIVYFFLVALTLTRFQSIYKATAAAVITWCGRAIMSGVFALYLLALERVPILDAWNEAFLAFTPAVYLFTLTAPFAFSSSIRSLLGKTRRLQKRPMDRVIIDGSGRSSWTYAQPATAPTATRENAAIRASAEFFDRDFQHAVQHVGEYSGVLCAILIDGEGLPVSGWSRGRYDQEMWSALASRIVDDFSEVCHKAGTSRPETCEFKTGRERITLQRVADMWLMSIADAATDELEKIRVHQAAEMITRHLQERYSNLYMSEAGRTYAGSAV